ncbi:chromosomal protein MC1 [Candidatus Calescamantes bacterium]|nr:chromosomal protein MC1 [Candidatus Calescamantes bacterium]
MRKVKVYSLRINGKEEHTFRSKGARGAALKAATRGLKDSDGLIKLREHGKKKDGYYRVHVFEGSVEKVKKPANAPDWLPDTINKPKVKKLRVEKLKEI